MDSKHDAIFAASLSKTWRSWRKTLQALENVTLRVPHGSAFGLLGPNGAGKTTFVKSVIGAVRPTGGSVTVFGHAAGTRAAARLIGYVPESNSAPLHLTAAQLLDLHATLCGVEAGESRRRIPEMLERVGLAEWASTPLSKYSRGMRQRAAIAAALIHRPQLLILDEPTDGLDPVGRRQVLDLLRSLNREQSVTLLINSHLLHEVEELCREVALLRNGRLVRHASLPAVQASLGFVAVMQAVPASLERAFLLRGWVTPAPNGGLHLNIPTRDELEWALDQGRLAGAILQSMGPASSGTLERLYLSETQVEVLS